MLSNLWLSLYCNSNYLLYWHNPEFSTLCTGFGLWKKMAGSTCLEHLMPVAWCSFCQYFFHVNAVTWLFFPQKLRWFSLFCCICITGNTRSFNWEFLDSEDWARHDKLLETLSLGIQTTIFSKCGKNSIFTEICCSLMLFSFLNMAAPLSVKSVLSGRTECRDDSIPN